MFEINKIDPAPTYPSNISGELRIILQIKDQFLVCFKYLESLNSLWESQVRMITKDFILEQIKTNEFDVKRLKNELNTQKELVNQFQCHNEVFVKTLKDSGEILIAGSSKYRIECAAMNMFSNLNKNFPNTGIASTDLDFIPVLHNIAEKLDAAQAELKQKIRPILEYYKDIYYLQLHFTLALTQISCYCMPLMTETVSLMDRMFFWSHRPEFELIRKSGQISDRLRDIYTRLTVIINVLSGNIQFLEQKIELQKVLENKCYEKLQELINTKDNLLDEIHSVNLKLDLLEEENDRLIGTLLKRDPEFVNSNIFKNYAEHKNINIMNKKSTKSSSSFDSRNSTKVEEKLPKIKVNNNQMWQNELVKHFDEMKIDKTVDKRLKFKMDKRKKYEITDGRTESLIETFEIFPRDKI